jgi:hypothetical protein
MIISVIFVVQRPNWLITIVFVVMASLKTSKQGYALQHLSNVHRVGMSQVYNYPLVVNQVCVLSAQ